jgi:ketosteroid isomerase-like protein
VALDNLAIADEMFRAWNSGNVDRMVEFWSEDGDWTWEDPPDMPDARILRGREPVEAHLRDLIGLLGAMNVEVEEYIELGDEVLAVTHFTVKGGHSGLQLDAPAFHLVRFDEGRVRRYRVFTEKEDALRAAEGG